VQLRDARTTTAGAGQWADIAHPWNPRNYPVAVSRNGARHHARTALDNLERFTLAGLLGVLACRLVPHLADRPMNALYLVAEAVVVLMVVFRVATNQVSVRPADWLIGFGGTFLPLLVGPGHGAGFAHGRVLMAIGLAISVGAQLSLRRSFGVVAANRGVKTAGVYAAVRHPMYVGYFFTQTGFLLTNPGVWNAAVFAVWVGCQLYRVHAEERVLSTDPAYIAFKNRVRYRLLPFIY